MHSHGRLSASRTDSTSAVSRASSRQPVKSSANPAPVKLNQTASLRLSDRQRPSSRHDLCSRTAGSSGTGAAVAAAVTDAVGAAAVFCRPVCVRSPVFLVSLTIIVLSSVRRVPPVLCTANADVPVGCTVCCIPFDAAAPPAAGRPPQPASSSKNAHIRARPAHRRFFIALSLSPVTAPAGRSPPARDRPTVPCRPVYGTPG